MAFDDALRWLARLEKKLGERRREIKLYDDYYEGRHPLAFASEKFRQVFGGVFEEFADNWCDLVVDAVEERLNVTGFRFGDDPSADQDANRFWQANSLDAASQLVHTESLVNGEAAVTVWAGKNEDTPEILVEHPSQVIVATASANPSVRLAALKMWRDEWEDVDLATVYLPDGIYKFKAKFSQGFARGIIMPNKEQPNRWVPREVDGEEWPLKNPLGVVPVVPLSNRPRLLKPGRSEIKNVIPIQRAINKLVADMLVASELGAMPARWATGYELAEDPETHQVIPPKITEYLNKFVINEAHEGRFGVFDATQLDNFVRGIEMLVQHAASQSRTPPHYFYLRGEFPSGESIKSAETGLVAKTRRKMRFYGEGWEEVMRLGFAVVNDQRSEVVDAETIWSDPESRTESEHIDAVVKRKDLGVPLQQLWEDAGYTPEQIKRFSRMRTAEALEAAGTDIAALIERDPEPARS